VRGRCRQRIVHGLGFASGHSWTINRPVVSVNAGVTCTPAACSAVAELHELAHDLAYGSLTIALAVMAHGRAQPPNDTRAGLGIAVLVGTSRNSWALEVTLPT